MHQTYKVIEELATERLRQVRKGFDATHDDLHTNRELTDSAAYLLDPNRFGIVTGHTLACAVHAMDKHGRRQQLVIAAALVIAEIERMDRLTK